MSTVRLLVNGTDAIVDADDSTALLFVLRHDLGLTGVRTGCGIGECGACTVLVDGRAARACQLPLSAVAGREVTTPEGLGTPAAPHPIQRAFLDRQAAQCGYCVNGIIMSVAGMLGAGDRPDREVIQETLAGHVCRCGAQRRILDVVDELAGSAEPASASARTVRRPARTDAPGKIDELAFEILHNAPNVEQWLRPLPDGRIELCSGRSEYGQGVHCAQSQVAAAALGVPVDLIVVRPPDTDTSPDEVYTVGSRSMDVGGVVLAWAAAAYRRLVDSGRPPVGPITPEDYKLPTGPPVGAAVPRIDLLPKLTGAPAFIHDLVLPDMLHARALLPPTYDARPVWNDADSVSAMPGVRAIIHYGSALLIVAEREDQAAAAVARLAQTARWDDPGLPGPDLPSTGDPSAVSTGPAGVHRLTAAYSKPHEAHASVAPSCAVACINADRLTVWAHNQGVYPLRRELAAALGRDESSICVRYVDGPGCYGHNGADDAAGFAAIAAHAVAGRPVRFQFSVWDEFGWEPYGPAMQARLAAELNPTGEISDWQCHVVSGAHMCRPDGTGDRLMIAWLRADGPARPRPPIERGALANAVPVYAVPARPATAEDNGSPLRTSALRSLGGYLNIFATESFMDELAERAGEDPLAFRLRHLRDERAREVLVTAAEAAGWRARVGPSGRGLGIAVAHFAGTKAYVAHAVEVDVDGNGRTIAVRRVVTVCDAGRVINSDGLANQLEGGTLQGLSRAMHEQVRYGAGGITSRDWTQYPVLRFAEVPDLRTILLDAPGPPLGVGEAPILTIAAALANAIDDAVGVRMRDLPITADRLRARLERMTGDELNRVRV